jgi:hypothetical protein
MHYIHTNVLKNEDGTFKTIIWCNPETDEEPYGITITDGDQAHELQILLWEIYNKGRNDAIQDLHDEWDEFRKAVDL